MTFLTVILGFLVSIALSLLATALVVDCARRFGWLEQPSIRGLHREVTLSRGGVGFVVFSAIALTFVLSIGALEVWQVTLLMAAGLCIALMGFIDDAHPLPILPRLGTQFAMVALAVWVLSPIPMSLAALILVIAWVWTVNLFNFMDGIDGLVATGVACIGLTAAILTAIGGQLDLSIAWVILAGACVGFLRWNWPPARIFMGDVGSGYLGYVTALLAVVSIQRGAITIWSMLVLASPFWVDTGFTLLRRMLRRERWYEAHRQHAYQKLVLRWGNHRRVTLLLLGLQVAVITPLALWIHFRPDFAVAISIVVVLVLSVAVWRVGAGTPEPASD